MALFAHPYRGLPADDRQEFRLPALLKEHVSQAALKNGQTIAEYITSVLAERVTADLARTVEWTLTVPEQETLLRALSSTSGPSARARRIAEKADAVFGPITQQKKKR
jgi:hypothetical protein